MRCASDMAMISEWAEEQLEATTRLTPITTNRPESRSNTPAANGPPVLFTKLRREKSITAAIRSSNVGRMRGRSFSASTAHSGKDKSKRVLVSENIGFISLP